MHREEFDNHSWLRRVFWIEIELRGASRVPPQNEACTFDIWRHFWARNICGKKRKRKRKRVSLGKACYYVKRAGTFSDERDIHVVGNESQRMSKVKMKNSWNKNLKGKHSLPHDWRYSWGPLLLSLIWPDETSSLDCHGIFRLHTVLWALLYLFRRENMNLNHYYRWWSVFGEFT